MSLSVPCPETAEPPPKASRYRLILVAAHVPFLITSPGYVLTDYGQLQRHPAVYPIVLGTAIAVIQLRHAFAAARGERPRAWPVTLAILALLIYVPIPWYSYQWWAIQYTFMASALMLLPRHIGRAAFVAPAIGTAIYVATNGILNGASILQSAYLAVYWIAGLCFGGVALYMVARLARVRSELADTRDRLAELAVTRERLRVSRDLHDLLGHSFSAISLKTDLAIRLLATDPDRAGTQIAALTEVAREAAGVISTVALGERALCLKAEIDTAVDLLRASGIRTVVVRDPQEPTPARKELLAWVVREGATNVVRHSDAENCWITFTCHRGETTLELVNDHAHDASAGHGHGLAGLAERVRAVSGSVQAGHLPDRRFRLYVRLPGEEQ